VSIYETTVGNPFTRDMDYSAFTGRVVAKHVIEKLGITRDGYVIGRVRNYIDIGRPSPVRPVDVDAQLADEPWERPASRTEEARAEFSRQSEQRHAAIEKCLVTHMTEHGPSTISELMRVAGYAQETIRLHLEERSGTVYQKHDTYPMVWGLIGQENRTRTKADALRAALLEHGPLVKSQLRIFTNINLSSIERVLAQHPDVFMVVGKRRMKRKIAFIYGLVGIHTTQNTEAV
jgi:hypothetical protein